MRSTFSVRLRTFFFNFAPYFIRGRVPLIRFRSAFLVLGGGPRVVVGTAAFHDSIRGSVPGLGGLKEAEMFLPHPLLKLSIVGSLRDREVACSASDRQGSNFECCVWRECHLIYLAILRRFSWPSLSYNYVHKGDLKPHSFHFIYFWSLLDCRPNWFSPKKCLRVTSLLDF